MAKRLPIRPLVALVVLGLTVAFAAWAVWWPDDSSEVARTEPPRRVHPPSTLPAVQRALDEAEARAAARAKMQPPDALRPDDFAVLNAALSHLAADPKFGLAMAFDGQQFVLHHETGGGGGDVRPGQVRGDFSGVLGRDAPEGAKPALSEEALEDLDARNNSSEIERFEGFSYRKADRAPARLAGFKPDSPNVVVGDLEAIPTGEFGHDFRRNFLKAYPDARAYVWAYLPGYSADGRRAIVRLSVGPSPHGTMATYLLERGPENGKWTVVWRWFTHCA